MPNYADMELLINAAGCEDVLDSDPIAWQLLKMRALKQRNESALDTRTLLSKSKEFEKRWQELLRLGSKRTHRSYTSEHRAKKKCCIDPTTSPTRVVTPTELLTTEASPPIITTMLQESSENPTPITTSRVTPSPKKK